MERCSKLRTRAREFCFWSGSPNVQLADDYRLQVEDDITECAREHRRQVESGNVRVDSNRTTRDLRQNEPAIEQICDISTLCPYIGTFRCWASTQASAARGTFSPSEKFRRRDLDCPYDQLQVRRRVFVKSTKAWLPRDRCLTAPARHDCTQVLHASQQALKVLFRTEICQMCILGS